MELRSIDHNVKLRTEVNKRKWSRKAYSRKVSEFKSWGQGLFKEDVSKKEEHVSSKEEK